MAPGRPEPEPAMYKYSLNFENDDLGQLAGRTLGHVAKKLVRIPLGPEPVGAGSSLFQIRFQ